MPKTIIHYANYKTTNSKKARIMILKWNLKDFFVVNDIICHMEDT